MIHRDNVATCVAEFCKLECLGLVLSLILSHMVPEMHQMFWWQKQVY